MRRVAGLLALIVLLALTGAPVSAQEMPVDGLTVGDLTVDGDGVMLVGGPLHLTISVEADDDSSVGVEVLVDGRTVATETLGTGSHGVQLDTGALGVGRHRVEVRSQQKTAETEITVLPGWLSIMPSVLAILLALIFKNVILSLFAGVWLGALFVNNWNPLAATFRVVDTYVINALTTTSRAQILIFSILLGGMVAIISKTGGTQGIVQKLSVYATTARRGQVASWLMGILIFFDDYANTLIVGSTMRPITDRLRVSREKLAYIVDSTAAPVVSIVPISTWVGFEIGLLSAAFVSLDLPFNAYGIFIQSIPFRFYQILALVLVLAIALTGRDFGPMLRAERRARKTGAVMAEDAMPLADYASHAVTPAENAPKRAINAFLPILTVILVTVIGLYVSGRGSVDRAEYESFWPFVRDVYGAADPYAAMIWGSLSGTIVALVLALSQRILSIREGIDAMVEGFKTMTMAFAVLLLAWSLGDVCTQLRAADFLVELTSGALSPVWLPTVVFVLAAGIAFATGTSWGVLAILTPLSIPLAHGLSIEAGHAVGGEQYMLILVMTIASVLAGSVWGDHCSPISDTTILSSMATGSDHIAHVRTQLPYAFGAGLVAVVAAQIPAAHGLHPALAILLGVGVLLAVLRLFGQPSDADGSPA